MNDNPPNERDQWRARRWTRSLWHTSTASWTRKAAAASRPCWPPTRRSAVACNRWNAPGICSMSSTRRRWASRSRRRPWKWLRLRPGKRLNRAGPKPRGGGGDGCWRSVRACWRRPRPVSRPWPCTIPIGNCCGLAPAGKSRRIPADRLDRVPASASRRKALREGRRRTAQGTDGGREIATSRRQQVESMSLDQKEQLLRAEDKFAGLAPAEQQRLRRLHRRSAERSRQQRSFAPSCTLTMSG